MAGKQKRGSKRGRGRPAGGKAITGSARAGLIFPAGRCNTRIRRGRYAQRVSYGAGVFMAGVLEYLTMEILDLAGQACDANKRKQISPRHIFLAVRNDDELNKLTCATHIALGGVLPNIQSVLWPKNKTPD